MTDKPTEVAPLSDVEAMAPTDRVCPILTLAAGGSAIAVADAPTTIKTVACLGHRCAFFLLHVDQAGRIIPGAGGCAVVALPSVMGEASARTSQALALFAQRAKIAPGSIL